MASRLGAWLLFLVPPALETTLRRDRCEPQDSE